MYFIHHKIAQIAKQNENLDLHNSHETLPKRDKSVVTRGEFLTKLISRKETHFFL